MSKNNIINEKFDSIRDYLLKITNNVDEMRLEFEIGLPNKWYYKSNDFIECEVLVEIKEQGTILKIYPKKEDVTTDDVINFIIKTIETNNKITEMEKSFEDKMKSEKEKIQTEVESFYSKIRELREKSFENLDDEKTIMNNLNEISKLTEKAKKKEKQLESVSVVKEDIVEQLENNKEDGINKKTKDIPKID